jgi:2',3'-cyclic-nucleotide 2'-phosphodiesterase (5'-nucleotidase family)
MIFSAPRSVRSALLSFALALTPSLIQAQQTAPIEPCAPSQETKKIVAPGDCNPPQAKRIVIDERIAEDAEILKVLEPYRSRVRELDNVIGRLEGDLKRVRPGSGTLGNFVSDGLRSEASRRLKTPVLLTVTNSGGMRRTGIPEGTLRVRDIFELLPFENALIVLDMTGDQVLKLLRAVLNSGDAQSGARITYRTNANGRLEFISASFIDASGKETGIDPQAVYSIVTIDYLYNLKSGNYAILREARNMRPIGITLRDAIINYVKVLNAQGLPVRPVMDSRFKEVSTAAGEGEQK